MKRLILAATILLLAVWASTSLWSPGPGSDGPGRAGADVHPDESDERPESLGIRLPATRTDSARQELAGGVELIAGVENSAGSMLGRVLAADGSPAPSAAVRLDALGKATAVDARGAFELRDVVPGERTVSAESFGLVATVTVDVPALGEVTGVELRLPPGGWIDGRMLDSEGVAMVDRPVMVSPDNEGRREVRTDAHGAFRLGPLTSGDYEVYGFLAGEFESDGIGVMMESLVGSPALVVVGESTRIVLQPLAGPRPRFAGVVLRDGDPLDGAFMLAILEARSYIAGPRAGTTDAEGHFDIELSGPGRQLVLVYPDGAMSPSLRCFVEVPAEGLTGVTLEHPTGAIVLEFEEGSPRMTRAELDPLDASISIAQLNGSQRMLANPDPTPRFSHLAAGRYRLTVFGGEQVSGPYEITLGDGDEVRVPVRFEPGGALNVRFDARSPLPDISLIVVNVEGRALGQIGPQHDPSEGSWTSPALPRGSWCVLGATSDGRAGATPWTAVTQEATAQAQMTLHEGARVVFEARRGGEPLPASFRLFDDEGRDVSSLFVPSHGVELVPTRSDEGHFGPLLPGRYRVVSRSADGESVERSVTLHLGETAHITIELPKGS